MENGRNESHPRLPAYVARLFLIIILGLVLSAGLALGVDLDGVWEAQLRGQLQKARQLLGTDMPEESSHRLTAAIVALEMGELEHAQVMLSPIISDNSHTDFAIAVLLLGRVHLANDHDAPARSAFLASIERSADGPYSAAAHLELIRLDLYAGDFDAAQRRLSWLKDLGPSPELEIAKGLLYSKTGIQMVRPFPSPISLFAAARLSRDGLIHSKKALSTGGVPIVESKDVLSSEQGTGVRDGLQPIHEESLQEVRSNSTSVANTGSVNDPQTGLSPVPSVLTQGELKFAVRVGSFSDPVNAQHMLKALLDKGFDTRVLVADGYQKVVVGAEISVNAVEKLLEQLRPLGYDGDVIRFRKSRHSSP